MRKEIEQAFCFDDVTLVPQYSNLCSRLDVCLSTYLISGKYSMRLPVLGSPMDTVVDINMQKALNAIGLLGCHHRYCNESTWLEAVKYGPVAVSPSMGLEPIKKAADLAEFPIFVVDTAHGDTSAAIKYASELGYYGFVVSGNICTREAAERYLDAGVFTLRVGVGSGAACSTRVVAGVGVPSISALVEVREVSKEAVLIADGGIRSSGDIVKALAAGADFVMLGRLLAAAKEAPGERRKVYTPPDYVVHEGDSGSLGGVWKTVTQKQYNGMAARETLENAGKEMYVEGVSSWIPEEGTVAEIVDKLERGIRAGFSYCGSRNIKELRENAEFRLVTNNGYREGLPHGV